MCTLQELKDSNNKEHNEIVTSIRVMEERIISVGSFSKTVKWMFGVAVLVIITLLGTITYFVGDSNTANKERYAAEVQTYKAVNDLSDTIAAHWERSVSVYKNEILPQKMWTNDIYDTVIVPNKKRSIAADERSKENARILDEHGIK